MVNTQRQSYIHIHETNLGVRNQTSVHRVVLTTIDNSTAHI